MHELTIPKTRYVSLYPLNYVAYPTLQQAGRHGPGSSGDSPAMAGGGDPSTMVLSGGPTPHNGLHGDGPLRLADHHPHSDSAPTPVRRTHHQTQKDAPRTTTLSASETDQFPRSPLGDPQSPDQIYPRKTPTTSPWNPSPSLAKESSPITGPSTIWSQHTSHNGIRGLRSGRSPG